MYLGRGRLLIEEVKEKNRNIIEVFSQGAVSSCFKVVSVITSVFRVTQFLIQPRMLLSSSQRGTKNLSVSV